MAEVTLETLHAELVGLRSDMQTELVGLRSDMQTELVGLRREIQTRFDEMQTRLSSLEARAIGLPLIGESIAVLQRNVRMLTAAVNDMARVNITAGEVEALHTELEQIVAKQNEIEAQLLQTRERLDRLEQRGTP